MIASARAAVPADIARLAAAGLTRNEADSSGSSGCGVYSSAKVASPAANSPSLTRRIPGSPCRSGGGWAAGSGRSGRSGRSGPPWRTVKGEGHLSDARPAPIDTSNA